MSTPRNEAGKPAFHSFLDEMIFEDQHAYNFLVTAIGNEKIFDHMNGSIEMVMDHYRNLLGDRDLLFQNAGYLTVKHIEGLFVAGELSVTIFKQKIPGFDSGWESIFKIDYVLEIKDNRILGLRQKIRIQ